MCFISIVPLLKCSTVFNHTVCLHYYFHVCCQLLYRKKTMHASPASVTGGDVTKTAASRQKTWSPLPFRRHHASGEGAGGGGSSATKGLRYVHTAESALNSSGGLTTDDSRNTTLDSSALTVGDVSVTDQSTRVCILDCSCSFRVGRFSLDGINGRILFIVSGHALIQWGVNAAGLGGGQCGWLHRHSQAGHGAGKD